MPPSAAPVATSGLSSDQNRGWLSVYAGYASWASGVGGAAASKGTDAALALAPAATSLAFRLALALTNQLALSQSE